MSGSTRLAFSVPSAESPWTGTWNAVSRISAPEAISETDLRYKYFGVNLEFVADETMIVGPTVVTLVDTALSCVFALKRVSNGEDAALGFTENDEVIRLQIDGSFVKVRSTKKAVEALVSRDELVAQLSAFVETAYSLLVREVPGLANNPVVQRLNVVEK